MDIHKEAISIAVMIAAGKSVVERIIETKASTILQFIQSVRGDLHVTSDDPSLVSLRRLYLYQRCRDGKTTGDAIVVRCRTNVLPGNLCLRPTQGLLKFHSLRKARKGYQPKESPDKGSERKTVLRVPLQVFSCG